LEYVGDCGSTHPQLLNYLKNGYDAQNGLVSNASSSSAASAGGGEPFSDDLSDFDDWYHGKVNELRQIQLEFAESPTLTMGHNAVNVNVDDSNNFDEVPANPGVAQAVAQAEDAVEETVTGLAEGEDQEGSLLNASAIQQATAPESRPTTPILSSNPQSGPPSHLGTPAPDWRLGAGGGGGGTLTNFSPGRYSEQSYREANMSQNIQSSSSAASQVGNTPLSQGRRSPTSSVVSAAGGGRQMQQLPIGGGGGPPSRSAATGEATYFAAGPEAQAAVYAVKPMAEGTYEFVLQAPPLVASAAAGGGASSSSLSSASAVAAKLQASAQGLSAGGGALPSSSSAAVGEATFNAAEAEGENIATSPSKKRRTEGEQESFPTNGTTGKPRRKTRKTSKTRRARRSTTRLNRR